MHLIKTLFDTQIGLYVIVHIYTHSHISSLIQRNKEFAQLLRKEKSPSHSNKSELITKKKINTHQHKFVIGTQTFTTRKVDYALEKQGGTCGKHRQLN